VRLAGIKVGRVSDIRFEGEPTALKVKIEISRESFARFTEDSKFFVNLAGLIGERYIEVVPGNGAPVADGYEFRGIDPPRVDQLISQGYGIFGDLRTLLNENKQDIKEILASLNELAKHLNSLMGSASPEQKRQLTNLLKNLADVTSDVRKGTTYLSENGGPEAWQHLRSLLAKGDVIHINDLRRLIMEDGVKVNFSSKEVDDYPWQKAKDGK
jgi:phospholipid/cholesterol/gamma-HCH transport system substrate-binding protein